MNQDSPSTDSDDGISARFLVTDVLEIAQLLQSLIRRGEPAKLMADDGDTLLTVPLLEVDLKNSTMYLDCGNQASLNARLVNSSKVSCNFAPDGVRIHFELYRLRETIHEGHPAFVAELPQSLVKIQRRDYFRVPTPLVNPVLCTLKIDGHGPLQVPLADISLGGFAMLFSGAHLPELEPGQQFALGEIELPGQGVIRFGCEVRHQFRVRQPNGVEVLRVGCAFNNLTMAAESQLQRYIAQLERDRRQKLG